MSNFDFPQLVQKILADETFADDLGKDPVGALKRAGIAANDEIIDAIKGVDPASIKSIAASFNGQQAAGS